MSIARLAIVALLLATTRAAGADIPAELAAVFEQMPAVERGTWAFTQVVDDGESVTVRRYDPLQDPEWTLVSVDGREPSGEDRASHEQWRAAQEQDEGYPGENDFAGLARPGSWQRRDPQRWQFAPDVSDDDFLAGHADKIAGELRLTADGAEVESFRLYATGTFRTRVVAKIRAFELTVQMQRVAERVYFPETVVARINGSALFRRIDRTVTTQYRDFRRRSVAPTPPSDAD